ncbi:DUF4174 domain-containing protein [Pseudomonas sp. CCC3.1]|uniref:DUF4174 domain-containing protein n=1 Tax=Pseudomonas sp. CCC3.1 TaxID=3048607 RepID=UPI002AC8BF0C|nr:DUF4174 domain-containing protein [Pseudomonas sp. CCC3.1]MEB0204303.1 DUF4174 domain-containing protein [Pseudomonas sp. CCC3.1]WPX34343.1 DUF4174 domain-containing protein [Pseudomonas sp. CCC3.1]
MFIRLLILASVLVTSIVQAVEVPSPLEQDRGKFRPLIIVTRTEADPTLANLKTALKDPANRQGFDERNMVLYTIAGITGKREGKDLEPQSTMSLIRGLKPGMIIDKAKVILIGKDGEKKLEDEGDVDLKKLFATIDALPASEKETQAQAEVIAPDKTSASNKAAKPAKPTKAPKALDD